MNNEGGSGGRNSYSLLSNSVLRSQTIVNRRSDNFRQPTQQLNTTTDNAIIAQARLANMNRHDDTHTI